jgi:hypothetical protein
MSKRNVISIDTSKRPKIEMSEDLMIEDDLHSKLQSIDLSDLSPLSPLPPDLYDEPTDQDLHSM